ncbi:MAG: TIGR03087 family PEP-CTERM/XrtA system glycosyltransferase [Deltaproteobacteria bacterium]|nr:TIGR03087 family PEP-CTERM/XrtA system glycosyltransferase [Deltaproteobacteria bacterium]
MSLNILFLAHRTPFPPNKGDKIRSFHEIKHLSKGNNLYLAFLVDDPKDLVYIDEIRKYCFGLDYEVISPRWQKIKSLPYLLTGMPLSVPYFYSKRLQESIDRRLKETRIDAIVAFSSPMAEYVYRSRALRSDGRRVRLVMDFVDVDSDKWRMYSGSSSFPASLVWKREWKTLESYEKKVGGTFDLSVFVSEKEVELFKTFCPGARASAISNGVDTGFYEEVREARKKTHGREGKGEKRLTKKGHSVLFMGAMDYFPNEDAVLYFHSEIWPHVKKEVPGAVFTVVGGNPSKKLKELPGKDPDVVVTGYVPDTRPYLVAADVMVAPLRIARGIQNKVLEAMAAGVPVVARPEAVQGLSGYSGCSVEKESLEFAMAVVEFINRPEKREKAVSESWKFIESRHNWGKNLGRFEEIIRKDPAAKKEERAVHG